MAHQPFWKGYYTQVNPDDPDSSEDLIRNLGRINLQLNGNELKGNGKHPTFGNYQLEGNHNNNEVAFNLMINNKVLICRGTHTDNVIEGQWGYDPDYDVGSFKFTRIVPKAGWNGHYIQGDIEYEMNFNNFNVEIAPNGKVKGAGSDENGEFQVEGTYDAAHSAVKFKKTYENYVEWDYWGTLANNQINGNWGNDGNPLGKFRLYLV